MGKLFLVGGAWDLRPCPVGISLQGVKHKRVNEGRLLRGFDEAGVDFPEPGNGLAAGKALGLSQVEREDGSGPATPALAMNDHRPALLALRHKEVQGLASLCVGRWLEIWYGHVGRGNNALTKVGVRCPPQVKYGYGASGLVLDLSKPARYSAGGFFGGRGSG